MKVLYVGRLSWWKGTDILNIVASKLPDYIQITAIGTGDIELHCNIISVGLKAPSEVAEYMRNSDMLVHPSRLEGLSRVIQEGMACGLPIIACPVGGNSELVQHGVNGLLVECNDRAILNAIILLSNNTQLRNSMSFASIELAKRFDWDTTVSRYKKIIKELVYENIHSRY